MRRQHMIEYVVFKHAWLLCTSIYSGVRQGCVNTSVREQIAVSLSAVSGQVWALVCQGPESQNDFA